MQHYGPYDELMTCILTWLTNDRYNKRFQRRRGEDFTQHVVHLNEDKSFSKTAGHNERILKCVNLDNGQEDPWNDRRKNASSMGKLINQYIYTHTHTQPNTSFCKWSTLGWSLYLPYWRVNNYFTICRHAFLNTFFKQLSIHFFIIFEYYFFILFYSYPTII